MPESTFLRAYSVRASDDAGKPGDPIRFIASTSDVARDNMIVEAAGWELENFLRNPVFQWAHNYSEPPIGKVTKIEVVDDKLMADVVFDQDDEFALKIERKYRNGLLNAVSVGFDIITMEIAPDGNGPLKSVKQELLELSGVPVPADPGALSQLQGRAYRSYARELDRLADIADDDGKQSATAASKRGGYKEFIVDLKTSDLNVDDAARLSWDETAAAMVDLFQPYSQRPDDERRTEYQRLRRAYRQFKKQAPDFATNAELEAYDAETLAGCFFEGEPELLPDAFARMHSRAGQMLSKRNMDDLATAGDLISGVIRRAQKEADDAAKSDDERAALAALSQISDRIKGAF